MIVNTIRPTSEFKRLYKHKLKHDPPYLVKAIDDSINELARAKDPKAMGEKNGNLDNMYAIRLNRDSRSLYLVNREDGKTVVELVRVCNHKQVYGTD